MNKQLISENSIKLTAQILNTVFNNFAEEKAFMLECDISYIANWYFGWDYMSTASNALQKVTQIVLRKKTAYFAIY